MKKLFYIYFIFNAIGLFAQGQNDENIEKLIKKYGVKPEFQCEIVVNIEVEGMSIPNKKIIVDFKKGDKPKVKGEGLALLPKKGTIDQLSTLLTTPLQAIYLSKVKNNLVYKLVSLDQKSDWITADVFFGEDDFIIYKLIVNTRKFGTFYTVNSYEDKSNIYPSKSVITFDIKKFKIPLKFIGRQENVSKKPNKEENVQGKITLYYTYL
ncbi:Beta-galactosidase [hydrothermal vent metagenome]|uniref:Beta-galactosidase n=1 Tax=hydrothermal vent metagenome TaxID=652676 RepID=A0A3B0RAK2_9ZZZZ